MKHPADAMVTPAELTALRILAFQSKTWAMIGVGLGGTAREMVREWADAYGEGRGVLLVDPYQGDAMMWCDRRYTSDDDMLDKAQRAVDWAEDVRFIRKRSVEAASDVSKPLRFVFIDGNHVHPHPLDDWKAWAPIVAPGGILAFHDTDLAGPKMAYETATKDAQWIDLGQVGTLGIVRRVPYGA